MSGVAVTEDAELSYQLRLSDAKLVFTDAGRLPLVKRAAQEVGLSADSVYLLEGKGEAPSIDDLLEHGELQWESLDRLEDLTQRTAVLNFSSGTTGLPKACMVSHRNLVANAEQNRYLDDVSRNRLHDPNYALKEIHVAYLPLYHAMGQMMYCTLNLRREYPSYIMPQFTLPLLLQAIHRYKVTYLLLVPPIAILLIKSPLVTQYDLSSVKFLLCGAAPLGKETALQLEKLFHANNASVKQAWGMSEATCSVTLFAPDEHDPQYVGVGYLCANMEAKIIADDGREVGYGEKGEAVLRGPNIFQGYYKNPEATRESWTEDGWLKTGDYVVVQPNGMFAVVDRKKELIKVKGFQVAPSELESHLLNCPLVSDCAVTRVMRNGEEHPQAHIVPAGKHVSAAAIHAFMEPRISAHKRITGGIVFTDAIPKSPSGKILRRLLKDKDGEGAAPRAKL
ncbi:related to 4-coumarate--ligase [Lasallia pustulata]|uniref:Related to 4-coumarate--ligase n=1 Tax=Lasallia pustulata TaxID=136370 RepID=A0A1W5CSR2_9LECA|nr:related to 4-coumarate--ligase [Lasallia pustulata]